MLQAQINLATAESGLLSRSIGYRRNLLSLLQVTGQLLDEPPERRSCSKNSDILLASERSVRYSTISAPYRE